MRIQHNISALNSYRQLGTNNTALAKNLEKLSSGYKINKAGDDAAGLAISEKMRAQIKGLETAKKNAQDGISLVQTTEGALTEVHSMLNRMAELATQSANGTYENTVDRANLQKEVDSLKKEIDRISEGTNFNGIDLLQGGKEINKATGAIVDGSGSAKGGITFAMPGAINAASLTNAGLKEGDKLEIRIGDTTTSVTISPQMLATNANAATINTLLGNAIVSAINNAGGIKIGEHNFIAETGSNGTTISILSTGSRAITADEKEWLGKFTMDIRAGKEISLQIGDTSDKFNKIDVSFHNMSSKGIGIEMVDISTEEKAARSLNYIKNAINRVSNQRGDLGAAQNRLEHTINNLGVTTENITAAESRIRDTDMANEMMAYTKNNILIQASQAMLAQANTVPQGVLQLLQ